MIIRRRGPIPDPYLADRVKPGTAACRCDRWMPVELDAGETRCLMCGLPSRRQVLRDQLARGLLDRLAA